MYGDEKTEARGKREKEKKHLTVLLLYYSSIQDRRFYSRAELSVKPFFKGIRLTVEQYLANLCALLYHNIGLIFAVINNVLQRTAKIKKVPTAVSTQDTGSDSRQTNFT